MKKIYVTTVMGPDSSGLVKSLAEETRRLGGEWLTSKVMKMDGRFTAMMELVVEEDLETVLKERLQDAFPELVFNYSELKEKKAGKKDKKLSFVVDCMDRSGLTRDINNILHNLDLVVEKIDCSRVPVAALGTAAFTARFTLLVDESMTAESIASEIETLSDDARVSVV